MQENNDETTDRSKEAQKPTSPETDCSIDDLLSNDTVETPSAYPEKCDVCGEVVEDGHMEIWREDGTETYCSDCAEKVDENYSLDLPEIFDEQ